ncbi:MAG: aminotransferase class V-fold PLP-dependent enzyme, partial [Alphaproteobacteria bacterium]|nr:aminotransferase class V-fold PLP-dependent enzyme [Alphaproteobacteria bacterium]
EAATHAIHAHEAALAEIMLRGTGNLGGLATMKGVTIIGGAEGTREGVISFAMTAVAAEEIVAHLNRRGIRTHVRKDDYYSANVLKPLGLRACVRVSYSHYNTEAEVAQFLSAMHELAEA